MRRQMVGVVAVALACAACGRAQSTADLLGPDGPGADGGAATSSGGNLASGGTIATTGGSVTAKGGSAANGGAPSSFGGAPFLDGGTSGDTGGASNAGHGGALSGTPPADHCSLLSSAPMPAPEELRFADGTLARDEVDCTWALGEAVALPALDRATRLLFHYDVNEDGIDDLFFGEPWSAEGSDAPVTLLLSATSGGTLTFEPADCTLSLPRSDRSYFVRDLDRDGALDLVIGTTRGVRAVVNGASGPETVLDYRFPMSERGIVALLDVAVGDFDADGMDDLAVGFDRAGDELGTLQVGALSFSNVAGAGIDNPPRVLRVTDWSAATAGIAGRPPPELGYLTAFSGGEALFGLVSAESGGTDGWVYRDGKVSPLPIPGGVFATGTFTQSTRIEGREYLFVGAGTLHAFDPLLPDAPGTQFYDGDGAFTHGALDRELGGGARTRRLFLFDLDGDGDDDLIERNPLRTADEGDFAIHNGDGASGIFGNFSLQVWPEYTDPGAETPFLALGSAKGRLLVSGLSPLHDVPSPTVRALLCRE